MLRSGFRSYHAVLALAAVLAAAGGCRRNPAAPHLQTLRDPYAFVFTKMENLQALQKLGHLNGEGQTVVASLLEDPNPYVRKEAAKTLRLCGDQTAVPYLERARSAEVENEVRAAIDGALMVVRGEAAPTQAAAPQPTVPLAAQPAPAPAAQPVAAPAAFGPAQEARGQAPESPAEARIREQLGRLRSPDPQQRLWGADALRLFGGPEQAPALQEALRDEQDPRVRVAIQRAIDALSSELSPAATPPTAPAPTARVAAAAPAAPVWPPAATPAATPPAGLAGPPKPPEPVTPAPRVAAQAAQAVVPPPAPAVAAPQRPPVQPSLTPKEAVQAPTVRATKEAKVRAAVPALAPAPAPGLAPAPQPAAEEERASDRLEIHLPRPTMTAPTEATPLPSPVAPARPSPTAAPEAKIKPKASPPAASAPVARPKPKSPAPEPETRKPETPEAKAPSVKTPKPETPKLEPPEPKPSPTKEAEPTAGGEAPAPAPAPEAAKSAPDMQLTAIAFEPSELRIGESAKMTMTCAVSGLKQGEEAAVVETRMIVFNGEEVRSFSDEFQRGNGLFTSESNLTIPQGAEPGNYIYRCKIALGEISRTLEQPFVILP